MVRGALERSGADIVMSITGVAGPAPDEDGNPVGMVYVAAGRRGGDVMVAELSLGGTPEEIKTAAMQAALALADELISSSPRVQAQSP
jgi:nicotinamide mononucleotide (NMN) deamidase PncC